MILRAATHETERGDHDFCLTRSHSTNIDPTSKGRVATAETERTTSTPEIARSTDWVTASPVGVIILENMTTMDEQSREHGHCGWEV